MERLPGSETGSEQEKKEKEQTGIVTSQMKVISRRPTKRKPNRVQKDSKKLNVKKPMNLGNKGRGKEPEEENEVKVVSRRPAKRRAVQSKKVTSKIKVKKASKSSASMQEEDPKKSEVKVVSRRPAKRMATRTRKITPKIKDEKVSESRDRIQQKTSKEEHGEKAVSRQPGKRKSACTQKVGKHSKESGNEQSIQMDPTNLEVQPVSNRNVSPSPLKWGRRLRRNNSLTQASSPLMKEGIESPVSDTSKLEQPTGVCGGTEVDDKDNDSAQELHRSRRRRHRTHRTDSRGGGEKEKDSQSFSVQPVPSLLEVLSDTWTPDKTKKFLSEGFLANLSFGLISGGEAKTQPNQEALKEPLKGIRKVLAEECMVEDDVTDLMLLDLVMNALGDRIEIYKLQAENRKLEDIDLILDLRYKADRRLIETLLALKNS